MSLIARYIYKIVGGLSLSLLPANVLAAEYGCGTYGSNSYDNAGACSNSAALTSTGDILWPLLVVGIVLILASIFLVIKMRSSRKKNIVTT